MPGNGGRDASEFVLDFDLISSPHHGPFGGTYYQEFHDVTKATADQPSDWLTDIADRITAKDSAEVYRSSCDAIQKACDAAVESAQQSIVDALVSIDNYILVNGSPWPQKQADENYGYGCMGDGVDLAPADRRADQNVIPCALTTRACCAPETPSADAGPPASCRGPAR